MTKKSKTAVNRVPVSTQSAAASERPLEADLPYVETPTQFGIVAAPYSAAARKRDLAWLLAAKPK